MRSAGDLLTILLLGAVVPFAVAGLPPRAELGPPCRTTPCAVPVEVVGQGVSCVSPALADEASLVAGDRVTSFAEGSRTRMHPDRLELLQVAIDINRASVEELTSLDGVGRQLAQRIVSGRPFARIEDIERVPGIGKKKVATFSGRLRVSP